MATNLDRNLSLAEMAAHINKGPCNFARLFKKSTGESPHRYLLRLRVAQAQTMIQSGTSIVEAALALGFSSQGHLSAIFKDIVGISPSTWREEQKANSDATY